MQHLGQPRSCKNKIRESTGRVVTRAGRVRINIDKAQRVNTGLTRINVLLMADSELVRNNTLVRPGRHIYGYKPP